MCVTDRARRSHHARLLALVALLSVGPGCTPFRDAGARDAGDSDAEGSGRNDLVGDCAEDADCPPSSQCTTVRCQAGACVIRSTRDGVPLADDLQVEGDCRELVCDGRGQARVENDDEDARTDGNPCRAIRCVNGASEVTDVPDGSVCNGDGQCQAGNCSTCTAGNDCSGPSDCTIRRSTCLGGSFACEDTGIPRPDRTCEVGKVCHDGSCVPCAVGAACDPGSPCYSGRITSCQGRLDCAPQPESGG